MTFQYPASTEAVLRDVSLHVPAGKSLALVGRSGARKSTLADFILGVLEPTEGQVLLDEISPQHLIARYLGRIGYVPQNVVMVNGTVRENVALGLPGSAVSDEAVWTALGRAHIEDIFSGRESGLDTPIGENGLRLSAGQRQRLGIARALLMNPGLLVMDEATSALDAETEAAITSMISKLNGTVTVLVIAHRLSNIRNLDEIAFLQAERLEAIGPFEEVRSKVPALQRQASLMGLS